MKKIACCLLIVWLALMSGGANAHANAEAAHVASHSHDHASHAGQNDASAVEEGDQKDIHHADTCKQSHCGHGHATGMLTPHNASVKTDASTAVPASRASWISSLIVSQIERPKWPVTTPAVVSLLS